MAAWASGKRFIRWAGFVKLQKCEGLWQPQSPNSMEEYKAYRVKQGMFWTRTFWATSNPLTKHSTFSDLENFMEVTTFIKKNFKYNAV